MSDINETVGAPKRGKGFTSSADSGGQEVSRLSPAEKEATGRQADAEVSSRARGFDNREPVAAKEVRPKERPDAAPVAQPKAAAPATPQVAPSAQGANAQMVGYDRYVKNAMGASPAEAMQMANAAAQQQGQQQADAAIRQAVKGAKTAGAMGGQAALAGSAQGASGYGQGLESGRTQYFDTTKLGASLGSEMSTRQARAEQTAAGLKAAQMSADASKPSGWDIFGNVLGGVGAVAGLFSDRNLKDNIEPDDITRGLGKIKGYSYQYKGAPRQEAGVIAQDLEKTAMAPAVFETPNGKAIDTRRLSTMNTAALSEHEKRLNDIARIVKGLADARGIK